MCASDKNPVDFPTSEQRCRLFPQSIRLFCIVCRTGAIFLSTLFHSLHYIICLIQTLCLFPPKIHSFITIPTKELSLPPFISFYESLRAILRLILSFSPFSHSFLPFSFFVFFSLLPIFSHFCPFSAPFIAIFSLLPVIFTKNTKSQSFLFAMHIYPWDGLVI